MHSVNWFVPEILSYNQSNSYTNTVVYWDYPKDKLLEELSKDNNLNYELLIPTKGRFECSLFFMLPKIETVNIL